MKIYNEEADRVASVILLLDKEEARTFVEMMQAAVAQRRRKSAKWSKLLADLEEKVAVF